MSTGIGELGAKPTPAPEAAHKPFSWLVPEAELDDDAQFAAITADICNGVATCLDLILSSNLDRDHNIGARADDQVTPTLSYADTERLVFLARASIKLLVQSAERTVDHRNTLAKEARAE